ncbi:outer membrane beta-barrel protein [Novosphingobium kaempferiae]|uniref:outer membrane beta-barrel protein n=1 Tax=Novosphingobium kaempferiae TaxID=2896849 RepID=UPI001E39EBC7|nr:outer membrane beta-barrel protein [Novosphingobium kaempferiae]
MLLLSAGWTQTANAQTIGPLIHEPDDVPGRRILPEYAAIGYDLAGFDVLPTVMFAARADDNVFTRSSIKRSDIALQTVPQIHAVRKDSAQNIAFDGSARSSTYLRLTDQDSIEYRLQGTYTRGTTGPNSVAVDIGYRREAIQRGTVENDLAAGAPLMRRVFHVSLTGRKQFNRLSVDTQVILVRQRYEDISYQADGILDQQFRNVDRFGLHGVATYETSGRTAIFASLDYDRFDYAFSPLLADRDAQNRSATFGLRYEISRVLYAQLGVGYRRYDFKKPDFGAIKGPAVAGHLRYFPTRLLAIRGTIEQYNTTSPYDLVGAATLTIVRVEAEYEMRRSLSWLGSAKVAFEDYGKQPYSARRFEITCGPRVRLNRWLSADANMGFSRRFVNGAAPFEPYAQLYAILSVTFAR